MVTLTVSSFLIVCPLLFLGGFIDAIGGGGGLIALPAYILAGLPPHSAIATTKLSSTIGTSVSAIYLAKKTRPNLWLSIPGIVFAIIGSSLGARLSLLVNEKILLYMMIVVLPLCAAMVLNKKVFSENNDFVVTKKTFFIVAASALCVGLYDGFYGPGAGTFLLVALTVFGKMGIKTANAQAKIINLMTNIGALFVYLTHGKVVIVLGLAAALFYSLGSFFGAKLMLKNPSKVVRPIIIVVLVILLVRILYTLFSNIDFDNSNFRYCTVPTLVLLCLFSLLIVLYNIFYSRIKQRKMELEKLYEKQEKSTNALVAAREAERKSISVELHDTLAQIIKTAQLLVSEMLEKMGEDSEYAADLEKLNEYGRLGLREIKRMGNNLSPIDLEKDDLDCAIRNLINSMIDCYTLEISYTNNCVEDLHRLPKDTQIHIYRLIQESINNSIRHSQCSEISVLIRKLDDGRISIFITDDGIGIKKEFLQSNESCGLQGMRYRVGVIGGSIEFDTEEGEGTVVKIII